MSVSQFAQQLLLVLVLFAVVSESAAQTPEKRAWSRAPETRLRSQREPELQPLFSVGVNPPVRRVVAQDADLLLLRKPDLEVPTTAELQRRREEKRQRYEVLQSRISGLVQEWQRSDSNARQQALKTAQDNSAVEAPNTTAPTQPQPNRGTNSPAGLPARNAQLGTEIPIPTPVEPRGPDSSSEPTVTSSLDQQSSTTSAEPSDSTTDRLLEERMSSEDVLVDGPVDRVALADNLYAIGRYTSALEMYARVDMSQLSADQQYWVQYQTASCHRQRGDLKAAREQLRIIASQEESGWLGRTSTWWLNALRDRSELEDEITALRERISERRDDSHAAANRQ